jgi:hypothetical protein
MKFLNFAVTAIALHLFSVESSMAQSPPTPPSGPAPLIQLIPSSPNAAALGEYGKVPVGLFTGTVEQNIPLYTINTGNYSLPLSLSYRSNGTRVSDLGSDVGLGWVLNAGGVITRTLNDKIDEYGTSRLVLPQPVDMNSAAMSTFLLQATNGDNHSDAGPDLFAFNFGKYAGRFYLTGDPVNNNMKAVLIDASPLKIEFLAGFYSADATGVQIRITDPEGIVYLFGGPTNAVEKTFSRMYNSGNTAESNTSQPIKSSWYLTKITLLNGEEINFSYAVAGGAAGVVYEAGISQEANSTITATNNSDGTFSIQYMKAWHPFPKVTLVTTVGYKLSEINWRNGKVVFTYAPRFTGGVTNLEKINYIDIYSKNNTSFDMLRRYGLEYLTADADPSYNNPNTNGSFLENSKRLFLSSLISMSAGDDELNRYRFDYYNTSGLPNRFSYAQDYWGYFNGKGTNTDLVTNDLSKYNSDNYPNSPFSTDYIRTAFSDAGGNKEADPVYSQKGMLQKITYPTGGYSILDYEPHSAARTVFTLPPSKTSVVLINGGSTSYTTPIIAFDQNKVDLTAAFVGCPHQNPAGTVDYDLYIKEIQSGANIPVTNESNLQFPTPLNVPLTSSLHFYVNFKKGKSYSIQILIHSSCTSYSAKLSFAYYSVDGTYSNVNDVIGGMRLSKVTTGDLTGNEEIKKYYYVKDFINASPVSSGIARQVEPAVSFYEDLNGSVSDVLRMTLSSNPLHELYDAQGYHVTYSTVTEGIGNNSEGGITVHNFNSVIETPPFPYADPVIGTPFTNVFGNGEEIKTSVYKNNAAQFTKVKEIINTYASDAQLSSSLTCFKATRRATLNAVVSCNLSTYLLNSQWRHLDASSEISYDQNGGNGSSVTTSYQYGNPLHLQPTLIVTELENAGTSNQHKLYTFIRYPQDYTLTGTLTGAAAVIKTMADRSMIATPIEQVKYSAIGFNIHFTGGQLSTYKMNGSIVTKDKDYTLKFNGSTIYQDLISMTLASINSSGQFVYDSHYELTNAYNMYDTSNNILEVTDRKNTSCLIREPNTGNVWAKATNCNYISAAYSSFEHSTPSTFTNWSYNVAGITTSSSQSGLKAFNLSGNPINTLQPLVNTQKYKVSFWRKIGSGSTLSFGGSSSVVITSRTGPVRNGWQYFEILINNTTSFKISGNYIIDDLRLYPQNAQMISYTYKDGVGPTSQCNENNQCTFWDYDDFNRLKLTKDQDGNILKKNEYQYQYIQN